MSRRFGRAERWPLACRDQCFYSQTNVDGERKSPRMTHHFCRSVARFRAPLLAGIMFSVVACNSTDSLNPDSSNPLGDPSSSSGTTTQVMHAEAGVFAGGIPMGVFALPTSWMGSRYNGAFRNIWPGFLNQELSAIKSRGGKVVLMFAGNERYYKDAAGHFSLDKWKQRVNRFRSVNFNSFISDGTIIGHYMIDEPNDPANWNGRPVSPSTLEEMARYSKQIWPNLVTVVRAEPSYVGGGHRYLDAAWAQYVSRKGPADDYIRRNVADAQRNGLALITGLNITKGGPNQRSMSASEVRSWGSALLNSSYPCAFISWQYRESYLSQASIKDAMDALRNKAEARATKSCRG
jgi:hypothetical protein